MKYWNKARIEQVRARERRKSERRAQASVAAFQQQRTYTRGDTKKNARLIFEALGLPLRRRLLRRLMTGGTMSLSKLAEPFNLTLPTAQFHLDSLARAGLVQTHKQGRLRLCVYNPAVLKEFGTYLQQSRPGLE